MKATEWHTAKRQTTHINTTHGTYHQNLLKHPSQPCKYDFLQILEARTYHEADIGKTLQYG